MKVNPKCSQGKRLGSMVLASAMLLQPMAPAYAVVSQEPAVLSMQPDANVMFTLDDSTSMLSDAMPDFIGIDAADTARRQFGMPNADGRSPISDVMGVPGWFARLPDMWWPGSLYRTTKYFRSDNAVARYMRSSSGNRLFYNPAVTYLPWPQATNDRLLNANAKVSSVNQGPSDPFDNTRTLNLTVRVNESGGAGLPDREDSNFWLATYYVYTGPGVLPLANPNTPLNVASNFTKVVVPGTGSQTYPKGSGRTDCSGAVGAGGCTRAEELQNFANWLQYYHNRILAAKGGVAAAFAMQSTNLRVGFASINSPGTVVQDVAGFFGARRRGFFTDLYAIDAYGGTPLRQAVSDVGQYFQSSGIGNPWAEDPTSGTVGKEYTCRKSLHIMSTDGLWNDAPASDSAARADNDNFSGQTPPRGPPTGPRYDYSDSATSITDPLVGRFTINPFKDGQTASTNTLSDAAAYYWRTDLRPDLDNDVFPSIRDPAFWQHLSMFTVGLGIDDSGKVKTAAGAAVNLSSRQVRDALIDNKAPLNWTAPISDTPATGDDLIHAAMVGRGDYFFATNPIMLKNVLAQVLAEGSSESSSFANVATESAQMSASTEVYQAGYTPNYWSGWLYAFLQSASGSVSTIPAQALWEASNKMPLPSARNIYTWNPESPASGIPFIWGNLTPTQRGNLNNDPDILDYLRGSRANEVANAGAFRDRVRNTVNGVKGGVLGDIVNSSPIKGPSAGGGFNRLPSGVPGQMSYATYRAGGNTALDNMRDTLFVGANDGMLHAFDRNTGIERFAFVPNSVFSVPRSLTGTEEKLRMLSYPGYTHRFTVDGPLQIGDAFIGSGAPSWRTVLLGSTGAGARSVFAIDITNPKVEAGGFSEKNLLWEFSEANNADMGYVLSYPHVARMRDGTWVAIFGNGYDSAAGRAKLFIVNLLTGAVLWERSVGAAGANGLSQPNFTVNNNREVTAIYAGDLKGNLWKFDVDNANPSSWKVAFGSAPNYTPLFTGTSTQPITVMPEIVFHPNGGTLVSFGTGQIFNVEDTAAVGNVNLNTQAIYGIWDKPGEPTGFSGNSALVQQQANTALGAASDATLSGTTTNTVDWASKRGWYMNLVSGGERVTVNPQQAKSTLLVLANTPTSKGMCIKGGSSRLFALNPITGGAPAYGVFDADGTSGITGSDKGYNIKSIASTMLSLPVLQSKQSVSGDITTEKMGTRGQTGERLGGVENIFARATDCKQWLLAGGEDTSITGFDIALCAIKPHISWRQLK